jgi:hypothetical protein
VCDRIERTYGVERISIEGHVAHVGFDKRSLWNVLAGPDNLLRRSVDTNDDVA